MNYKPYLLALSGLLLAVGTARAFNDRKPEWADETVSGVNKEKACAVTLPFDTEAKATTLQLEDSPYYMTLNGTWRFHWVADPKDRPADFYLPDYDVSGWDSIRVPVPWQIEAARRQKPWDKPLYCNTIYPFSPVGKVQWPNVIQPRPENYTFATMPNPVGSYRREFSLPEGWEGRDVYIRFNGVEAGFYVWLNGEEVGYSEDSYLPAEFNLTPYLKKGKNVLAVEVYRFTDGSYLECQDFWRFSGIFRDVFLWSAPRTQIRDFFFRTDLDSQYKDAAVTLDVDIEGRKARNTRLLVKLTDAQGNVLHTEEAAATNGQNRLEFTVQNPLKWTAETPNLYDLTLQLVQKGETIDLRSTKVGFREVEITKEGRFLVNGKPILFKGTNRHDHSALNGRTVSKEEMEKDVQLIKSLNLNAVRTSHYPNNPYFYDLCDRYGLYVMAEANVECHGLQSLSSEPTWEKAFVERNENMVLRYRNHASIVVWSMGNESGRGVNFRAAEHAIKALDSTRPSHYEGNSDYCDMTSSMYSNVQWVEGVGRDRLEQSRKGEAVRPHVLCEYAHAMGNAIGNFREYWETFERYPALIGGFVWDWVDQSIQMPVPGGNGYYKAVGGDFGDTPNDGNFCTNGIIFADRTYSAKALEVKKISQPVVVTHEDDLRFRIANKRFHTGIDDLYGRYELMEDGTVIRSGQLDDLHLEAQQSTVVSLPQSLLDFDKAPGAEYFIRFTFRQKADTYWAKAGYEVAADQIKLADSPKPVFAIAPGKLSVEETPEAYVVKGEGFAATFSKAQGTLSQYVLDEVPMLAKGPELNAFRAPTDNDKHNLRDWQRMGLRDLSLQAGAWTVKQEGQTVTLQVENIYTGRNAFSIKNTIAYTVCPDGSILVNSIILPSATGEIIPRIGYKMLLPEGFERMRWFGCGPFDNYVDRKDAAFAGVYDARVADQWVDFVRPQVMANHEDVRWIAVTNAQGMGFAYVAGGQMSTSAQHVDERDMVYPNDWLRLKHPYEVPRLKETVLCLDAAQRPLGNASCGPGPMEKYELRTQPVSFSFLVMPLRRSYSTEELSRKARVQMPAYTSTLNTNAAIPVPAGTAQAQRAIYVDSDADNSMALATDGNADTYWHTVHNQYYLAPYPHELHVELQEEAQVSGLRYTPRQDSEKGRVATYEIYVSQDGKEWGSAVATGSFSGKADVQTVNFKPVTGRYVMLKALSAVDGGKLAAVAELEILTKK